MSRSHSNGGFKEARAPKQPPKTPKIRNKLSIDELYEELEEYYAAGTEHLPRSKAGEHAS